MREERIRLNLSQEDLAQAGGVNRNTQGTYERGGRNPDTSYLAGVATLGVDTIYVLCGRRFVGAGLSDDEAKVVANFRSIPEDDQRTIVRILKAMADDVARQSKGDRS
ncbi:XRE family transcriptional regulator [Pseudomonas sp. BCA14]|nr:XRE family transcriptional regulator [Pseudomonas sp. JMN1]TFF16381.1 XRE family transcriptional regulator [Pseudomonas sp. BCA17]TFF30325.1 XRE family transcriptional regulator [Pseudomonas sp. BCA13]TFF32111.1 XRE family transcriptional regulator [Pseudomonas sp. BCA14]